MITKWEPRVSYTFLQFQIFPQSNTQEFIPTLLKIKKKIIVLEKFRVNQTKYFEDNTQNAASAILQTYRSSYSEVLWKLLKHLQKQKTKKHRTKTSVIDSYFSKDRNLFKWADLRRTCERLFIIIIKVCSNNLRIQGGGS